MADVIRPPKNRCPHCQYAGWFPDIMNRGAHVWRCHSDSHIGDISNWPRGDSKDHNVVLFVLNGIDPNEVTAYRLGAFLKEYTRSPGMYWDFADAIAKVCGRWAELVVRIRSWQKKREDTKSS